MRPVPGLGSFAPVLAARGPLFSSRARLQGEQSKVAPVVAEEALG